MMRKDNLRIAGNEQFEVRRMIRSDLPDIMRIEKNSFSNEAWSHKHFTDALNMEEKYTLLTAVEKQGMRPVGFIVLSNVVGEVSLENIAVEERLRRRGVGRLLISAAAELLSDIAEFITLEVRAGNAPAIHLYTSAGFRKVGERRSYYSAPHDDAILMTLDM